MSATPFHRLGWWTRSSRPPRFPPCAPSRVQKPAQQERPAALRRLSYVRKSAPSLESFLRTHPAPIQPHPPLLPPASLQGAPPTAGLTPGAGRSSPTPGLSAHGVAHSPSRGRTAPRRAAPPLPPPVPFLSAPSAARRTQAQRDPCASADTRVGVLSRGGGGMHGVGGPPGRGAGEDGGVAGAASLALSFPAARCRRPRCPSPLLPSREA